MSDIRQRALDAIARAEATLAAPRDPDVIEAAARWEATMPKPVTRNTTAADAYAARPQPAPRVVTRQAPGVSPAVVEALAKEAGAAVGALEKRVARLEEDNLKLYGTVHTLSEMLSEVLKRDGTALEQIDHRMRALIAKGERLFGRDDDDMPMVPRVPRLS